MVVLPPPLEEPSVSPLELPESLEPPVLVSPVDASLLEDPVLPELPVLVPALVLVLVGNSPVSATP